MDTYQPIYDAVSNKIGHFSGEQLIQEIAGRFDFSHHAEMIKNDMLTTEYERQQPAVLYRPALSVDGNQWCALYGANLQDGIAGFGDSPAQAMDDFNKQWHATLGAKHDKQ